MHTDASNFDMEEMARVLAKYRVECVIIGGVAAILHGSDLNTVDFDMVPLGDDENLSQLTRALVDLEAEVLYAGKVLNFPSGGWLAGSRTWNFQTRLGRLDVMFAPSGAPAYEELSSAAVEQQLEDGTVIRIASLDDLIVMKEAAGRPKDKLAIPILEYLRDRDREPR